MKNALLCLVLSAVGCTSWDVTRTEVVEPINTLLHRDYPRALQGGDAAAVAALLAPGAAAGPDGGRGFDWQRVEHASCVILGVESAGGTAVARVVLRLDGVGAGRKRRTRVEHQRVQCRRLDGGWKIAAIQRQDADSWSAAPPAFRDETAERGLAFSNRSRGVADERGEVQPYLPGSGLAVGDTDGDGDDDVVLVSGAEVRLFRNDGGRFEDVSEAAGLGAFARGEGRYAVIVDLDGDGDRDVFVGVLDGPNLLYRNDGSAHFTATPADGVGITSSGETTGACCADFDRDGDLDLYVVNGGNLLRIEPDPVYNAKNGNPNQLFLNDGSGRFTDATARAGVGDTGWALACCATDYDQDGDVDLFVANDFGQDCLFRNRGDGTFDQVAEDAGIHYQGSSMGITAGDCDGDGDLDLFVTGMQSNSAWMLDQPGFPAPAPWWINLFLRGFVLDVMRDMLHGNRLYLNRGDGTFDEVSAVSRTARAGWAWGGVFLDYDNDGRLDVYVVNGLLSGELHEDC